MAEVIAQIILLGSLVGLGTIILRKIPVISELPEIPAQRLNLKDASLKLKERIKILNPWKNFSYEVLLQKILSKIRILTLKTDSKTFNWLQRLRERSQKKKIQENDNYWEEIKKSTNQRKKI